MFRIVRHHRQPMDKCASGNKHICVIDDQPIVFKRGLQFPECLANRIIRFDDVDAIGELSHHGEIFVNPLRLIGSLVQFTDSNEGHENVINSARQDLMLDMFVSLQPIDADVGVQDVLHRSTFLLPYPLR